MVNTRNARDKGLLSRAASKSLKDGKFTRAVEIKRAAAPAAKTPASIKRTAASKSAPTHRATSAGTKVRV